MITPVDWFYQPSPDASGSQIISEGHLPNGDFGGRLTINGSTLVMENVRSNDSGVYTCAEDGSHGNKHSTVLVVKGKFSTLLGILTCEP